MTAVVDHQTLLDELAATVGVNHVYTDLDITDQYRGDMQPLVTAGRPLAVVRPRTTAEVAAVVKACSSRGIPIVPRGAGSGMTGAANAQDGAVSLVLTRMNDIVEIDIEARVAVVQPGVITLDLKKAAAAQGLFYAPDPTSSDWCTIGGNLANGAGGPCGSKYGVTADSVLGLEVVLASGEILRTGRRTVKGVTGYDLNRLFVGSEGTLGVITQATLSLRKKPAPTTTCVAAFGCLEEADKSVTDFLEMGYSLSLLEIMDGPCISAVEKNLNAHLLDDGGSPAAVLFAQSDSGHPEELNAFEDACNNNGALFAFQTDDEAEGEMLMQYWYGLEAALETMGTWVLHEVTVPRRQVAPLINHAAKIAETTGLFVGIHGHAADGTVHPMIVFNSTSDEERQKANEAYQQIIVAAMSLGGTVSGEHGIGRMKKSQLSDEIGPIGMAVHRAIKTALDENGIFNPDSMFSLDPSAHRHHGGASRRFVRDGCGCSGTPELRT